MGGASGLNPLEYLILYITPYISLTMLVGGFLYKLYGWFSSPRTSIKLTMYPAPQNEVSRIISTLSDLLVFADLMRSNFGLWLGAWSMHLGLFMAMIGHIRMFYDYLAALGIPAETAEKISHTGGGIAGILFMTPLFYLFARRWGGIIKELSTPEDYFDLFLLIAIAVTGNHMRFFQHVNLDELQTYFMGLFTFTQAPPPKSGGLPFLLHYALVQLLMVYLPFGRISHLIGGFFSKHLTKR